MLLAFVSLLGFSAIGDRLVGDPSAAFAELRDRPRREAGERADRRRLARDTLARAGFVDLVPVQPQRKHGVLAAPGTPAALRPRAVPGLTADGSVGWREGRLVRGRIQSAPFPVPAK